MILLADSVKEEWNVDDEDLDVTVGEFRFTFLRPEIVKYNGKSFHRCKWLFP